MKTFDDIKDHLFDGSLRGADLTGANLRGAYLRGANFSRANLFGADLTGANLRGADLHWADLCNADLNGADLYNADLIWSLLNEADLTETNLSGTDLHGTNLTGTNLTGTVLDPDAPIPSILDKEILDAGLEIDEKWVLGWRTRHSQYTGLTEYVVRNEPYVAPWFSVCKETSCHPGIYLTSKEWLEENYSDQYLVRCKCLRSELIHAKDKWRCKRLWIIEG